MLKRSLLLYSSLVWAALVFLGEGPQLFAQDHVGQYSQTEVENGSRLFSAHCTVCHGPDGDLVQGVDLRSGQFRRASSDEDLTRIISTGIPNTAMPPGKFTAPELAGLVAYLRSGRTTPMALGDPGRGQIVFEGKGNCATCHRVNGKGSRVAPDLSDIGAIRAADALQRSLMDPSRFMRPINRPVRAMTRDGKVINGRRLNEDTYTVQLLDDHEHLVSLAKANLREYKILETSPMPSYTDKLTSEEFSDLVAYLLSLKGLN